MINPKKFFEFVNSFQEIRPSSPEEQNLADFIRHSSAKELEEALLLCMNLGTIYNIRWVEQAKVSLHNRIAEQAAESASKLIQHTEQLTKQTDIHIQHSEKLTQQTEKLIAESVSLTALTKQLRFWTIMLGVLAVVQIVIMVFDYLKHK